MAGRTLIGIFGSGAVFMRSNCRSTTMRSASSASPFEYKRKEGETVYLASESLVQKGKKQREIHSNTARQQQRVVGTNICEDLP